MTASLRTRLRRFGFGLATVSGLDRRGFFIPYRYAAAVQRTSYPALLPHFEAAAMAMGEHLREIERHEAAFARFAGPPPAPRFDQGWFPTLDAAAAYAMIQCRRPKRLVEIGSGHSTRFLVRAGLDQGLDVAITCIDPAPRASLEGLPLTLERRPLQEVGPALFDALAPGDVLFIDSSHILMPGTDLDLILNAVLPRLPAGMLLHIHDIFLPDPYPESWTWRGYNEQSVWGALLQSGAFSVLFSSHYIEAHHPDWLAGSVVSRLPRFPDAEASSLWLEKRSPG